MINIICVAVRLKSNRLKRKALLDLNGVTLIERLIERLLSEFQNDEICICTSRHEDDEPLVEIAKKYSLNFVGGEELDVMSRFIEIGNRKQAENITRVTGDNPLTDPKIITQMLLDHIRKESDYTFCNQIPIGAGSEIVKFKTLKKLYSKLTDPNSSEYMTYMLNRPDLIKVNNFFVSDDSLIEPNLSLTVDNDDDYRFLKDIYNYFEVSDISLQEVISFCRNHEKYRSRLVFNNQETPIIKGIDYSYIDDKSS